MFVALSTSWPGLSRPSTSCARRGCPALAGHDEVGLSCEPVYCWNRVDSGLPLRAPRHDRRVVYAFTSRLKKLAALRQRIFSLSACEIASALTMSTCSHRIDRHRTVVGAEHHPVDAEHLDRLAHMRRPEAHGVDAETREIAAGQLLAADDRSAPACRRSRAASRNRAGPCTATARRPYARPRSSGRVKRSNRPDRIMRASAIAVSNGRPISSSSLY